MIESLSNRISAFQNFPTNGHTKIENKIHIHKVTAGCSLKNKELNAMKGVI
ncbi:hypothetical protein HMPREF0653_00803 [Prevotella disiens JCM 6334 = ATCC 29426]|uniref:Uncharacterized protein n=1 Tax=Prevotella disiens JCM 6334 = ATCC 29426 TaxID=1235811 RepID=A0ABN0NTW3_9BACT|nr:hypothetical protein HMPREF0653_00803 [Prevotella disiens JCM 6334 = ATCC 29426]